MLSRVSLCLLVAHLVAPGFAAQCGGFQDKDRVDCFPEPGASQQKCQARGCCWQSASGFGLRDVNVPYCFFPTDAPSYNVDVVNQNDSKIVALMSRSAPSGRSADIPKLRLTVTQEARRLRFRIEDNSHTRWEPPIQLNEAGVRGGSSEFQVNGV